MLFKNQFPSIHRLKTSIFFRKHGRKSSVLFENIDFYNEHNGYLIQLLSDDKFSDFDFHFISKEFNKSTYNLHREIVHNESLIKTSLDEIKQENNQLKLQLQQQSDEFNQKFDNLNNQINQMAEIIKQQREEINELKKPHINIPYLSEQYPQGIISFLNGLVNISAGGNHHNVYPLYNIRYYDNSYFYN